METPLTIYGRTLRADDIAFIRQGIAEHWARGRKFISRYLCQQWHWVQPNGGLKDMACRGLLLRLEALGVIVLPPRQTLAYNHLRNRQSPTVTVDRTPWQSALGEVGVIELRMVRWSPDEKLFNGLIGQYHYLGYKQIIGAHLKYVAFAQDRPLACLGWGAAARRVSARDRYIGWSDTLRRKHLHLIAQNTRYLILPWVRIRHLASHLLAANARRLAEDWPAVYGHAVVLLETFVDTTRFAGTCYRAANWRYLGLTAGRGKYDRQHRGATTIKAVWVYPLRRHFQRVLLDD